jgi:polyphosphate kinase
MFRDLIEDGAPTQDGAGISGFLRRHYGDVHSIIGALWLALLDRNLDRRVEVLFPVESPVLRTAIILTILPAQLNDTLKVRLLQSDGSYVRKKPSADEPPLNAQTWLVDHRGLWYNDINQ